MNVGFTYEIRDKTNPDLVYYGSSELSTLDDRMKHHLQNFNNWKNNNNNGYCSSYKILELNNYKAEMIKIVFFTIKWELREQERKLIENNECVNHNIPNRTNAEYYQANREQLKEINKEWREANKEHIKELNKEYREANREQIKEQKAEWHQANKERLNEKSNDYYQANKEHIKELNKEYREANREQIKEQKAEWHQANKERLNEKMTCGCGCIISKRNKLRHLKTAKHRTWVNSQLMAHFDKWKKSVGV